MSDYIPRSAACPHYYAASLFLTSARGSINWRPMYQLLHEMTEWNRLKANLLDIQPLLVLDDLVKFLVEFFHIQFQWPFLLKNVIFAE